MEGPLPLLESERRSIDRICEGLGRNDGQETERAEQKAIEEGRRHGAGDRLVMAPISQVCHDFRNFGDILTYFFAHQFAGSTATLNVQDLKEEPPCFIGRSRAVEGYFFRFFHERIVSDSSRSTQRRQWDLDPESRGESCCLGGEKKGKEGFHHGVGGWVVTFGAREGTKQDMCGGCIRENRERQREMRTVVRDVCSACRQQRSQF